MGRGRGGIRRWREWLHGATHHSAAEDNELVEAAEQSRRDADDQASLDQVLRRAAEARASQDDRQS